MDKQQTAVKNFLMKAYYMDERIMKALSAKDATQTRLIDAVKAEVTADDGN